MAAPQGRHENIPEYLSTAVVLIDGGLSVRYLNPSAEALFGVSARQIVGLPLSALARGLEGFQNAIAEAIASDAAFTERERRLCTYDARHITVDITVTPLPPGEALLECVQLDRHLRISREHSLITQNRAMREVVRGLAHEIKNPLGGLRGAAQLLERELEQQTLKDYTRIIIGEADRLQALVDNMLGPYSRPQRRRLNIHEVLERVRQLVQAEAPPGVRIVRDYDPSIPSLVGEFDQLIQALLNISRNALQAVGTDGTITFQTRTQRQFTIADTIHKLVARIDIQDDGPGVPPELIDQIFYPMVTSRAEGSGLGLPIAQTLVARHGGLIECVSERGRTVFTVWLPLEDV